MTDTPPQPSALSQLWSAVAATAVLGVVCCGVYPLFVWGVARTVFPHQANGSLLKRDGTPTTDDKQAAGSALLGQVFAGTGYFHPRPSAANNSAGSAATPTSFSPAGGYDPTSSGATNYGPLSDTLVNGATTTPTTQPAAATTAAPTTAPVESLAYDGVRLRTLHYAVDNGLSFKLYSGPVGGKKVEVPLKQYQDAAGNLNDVALVDAFPHPNADAADRVVLTIGDGDPAHPIFTRSDGTRVLIPGDAVTASGSGLDPHIGVENAALQTRRVADARHATPAQVAALADQYTDGPGLGFLGEAGVNVLRLNLALDAKYPLPAAPTTQPAK